MARLRVLTAVSFLVAALTGAPTASQPQDARPVFRSGLEIVRLDVRVTDDEGRPIADLRPEELQLTEEGAPRPILLFQHVSAPEGTYTEAAQRTAGAQVSTNRGAPRGHVYILVFDEAHILSGREQRARRAAERFLRTHVRAGDRVALYALPGPGPQIDFTADVRRVIGALTAVRGVGEETGLGALSALAPMRTYEAYEIVRGNQKILDRVTNDVSEALLASDTRTSNRREGGAATQMDNPQDNRRVLIEDARRLVARADGDSRRFLAALADIVRTLRGIEGRKAVIMFSEGFQTDNLTHELEEVAAAAAQSYAVVDAMDLNPRTLDVNDTTPRGGEIASETLDKLQGLGALSGETSGVLVPDAGTQLDRALGDLAAATEDYYLVGFTPAEVTRGARDRYRRIHVSVTRPGAHVSARTGYSVQPKSTPADRRRAIDTVLRSPFAQEGLPIEYTTYVLRGEAGLEQVILSLSAELPLRSESAATADVVYLVRDATTGRVAASGTDRLALPTSPSSAGASTGTSIYRVQFPLPAGTYLMRAVVREAGGLVGSADRRFEVRAMHGPDIAASDLVLRSSEASGPPVRATVRPSETLTGLLELYGQTAPQLEGVSVMTDLVPVEGGPPAISASADIQPVADAHGPPSRGAAVALPLTHVAPGEYVVRATIRRRDDTIAEVLRDVSVRPGEVPSAPPAPDLFDPLHVLRGELARGFIGAIDARAKGGPLERAAHAAMTGRWEAIDAALAVPGAETADGLILRGLAAFARADYRTGTAALGAARDSGAPDAGLMFVLGWSHAAAGDERAAITAWRGSVLLNPTLIPPYLALADAYLRLGHPMLARQVLESGLAAVPDSPELIERVAQLRGR